MNNWPMIKVKRYEREYLAAVVRRTGEQACLAAVRGEEEKVPMEEKRG